MKNFTLSIIICLISLYSFAQKEFYKDVRDYSISKDEFSSLLMAEKKGWGYVRTDTAIIQKISQRYYESKLPQLYVQKIRTTLEDYSKEKIDSKSLIIVNYYSGIEHLQCSCYQNDSATVSQVQFKFINKINKKANAKVFTLLAENFPGHQNYKGLANQLKDRLGVFNPFLNLIYPLNSYIILRPDGRYIVVYGITDYPVDILAVISQMGKSNFKSFKDPCSCGIDL